MDIQRFTQHYRDKKNLYGIPWDNFPEEIQRACLKFIGEWQEFLSVEHLRDLSGFNEMSFQELMRYSYGKPDEDKPESNSQISLF